MVSSGKKSAPVKDKSVEKRPQPKSGKNMSYGAKAITGKTKSYCGG